MRYFSVLLLGLVVGAAVSMLLVAHQLERTMMERDHLILTLMEYRTRLDRLRGQLEGHQAPRSVESVELVIQGVEDEAHTLGLKKYLQAYTAELVGHEIRSLDPYLVIRVFDDRTVRLDGDSYHLSVEAVVLDQVTRILLEAQRLQSDPGG